METNAGLVNPNDIMIAFSNPHVAFADPHLKAMVPKRNKRGRPTTYTYLSSISVTGLFEDANKQFWRVQCYPVVLNERFNERYRFIEDYLNTHKFSALLPIAFQESGVLMNGNWHPLVKYSWEQSLSLREYLFSLKQPEELLLLASNFRRAHRELRNAGLAHGNLNLESVFIFPDERVIFSDYDTMFIPEFADFGSIHNGHRHFQHPQRFEQGSHIFNSRIDNFSAIIIYFSLLSIAAQTTMQRSLQQIGLQYGKQIDPEEQGILLSQADFLNPEQSSVLNKLAHWGFGQAVQDLTKICRNDIKQVPELEEFITRNNLEVVVQKPTKLFISHTTSDDEIAANIAHALREAGYETFVDHEDIAYGDWDEVVEEALANSTGMILIISSKSMESKNVKDEWHYFIEEKKSIFPIVIEDCQKPFRLRRLHHIDFRNLDFVSAMEELLDTLTEAFK